MNPSEASGVEFAKRVTSQEKDTMTVTVGFSARNEIEYLHQTEFYQAWSEITPMNSTN